MSSRNLSSSNLNFSVLTLSMSLRYFGNELYKRGQKQLLLFLKGLCWVSVCWILNIALCSMSRVFSVFYFVPHCPINIWYHMLCYLPNIYNYITFMASLERVKFELMQSFTVVEVLYFSDFVCKRSLNSFDSLYVFSFPWIPELAAVL